MTGRSLDLANVIQCGEFPRVRSDCSGSCGRRDQGPDGGMPQPAQLAPAHASAFRRGGIVGAGQVVEPVGDVERHFVGGRPVLAAGVLEGDLHVDENLALGAGIRGGGLVPDRHDVGAGGIPEDGVMNSGDACRVGQGQRDGAPAGAAIAPPRRLEQRTGQPPYGRQVKRACLLAVVYA